VSKSTVVVHIRGREFRIRSEEDEGSLRRVAGFLDETMATVEARTGAVDSLGVAMLTALNLAREVIELRDGGGDPERVRALIDLAESALEPAAAGS